MLSYVACMCSLKLADEITCRPTLEQRTTYSRAEVQYPVLAWGLTVSDANGREGQAWTAHIRFSLSNELCDRGFKRTMRPRLSCAHYARPVRGQFFAGRPPLNQCYSGRVTLAMVLHVRVQWSVFSLCLPARRQPRSCPHSRVWLFCRSGRWFSFEILSIRIPTPLHALR